MSEQPAPKASAASVFWVVMALLSGAIEPITVKLGYRTPVTPLQLLLMKNITAAVLIVPLTRAYRWIGWKSVARIASASLLLMLTNACSLVALFNLPAVTVLTIVTTTPAVVALVNQMRGAVILTRKFWFGFACCFSGVLMTVDAFHPDTFVFSTVGLLAAGGAVASSTVYRVRMESLTRDFSPKLVSTYIFLINAFAAIVFLAPFLPRIPNEAIPIGLWIGFAGAIANVAFLAALHLVGSTNISVYLMLERPLIIICAAWILSEKLSLLQILGTFLVLVGIRMAQAIRRVPAPTPVETELANLDSPLPIAEDPAIEKEAS